MVPACFQSRSVLRCVATIEQIVHLHQVDALRAHQAQRRLHLIDAGLAPAGPDLGGEKQRRVQGELGRELADHAFGAAIHRRAVDDAGAAGDESLNTSLSSAISGAVGATSNTI